MTESSWPFDNADTTEAQFSYLFRAMVDTGVIGSPSTSELKAYADSSGMFVKVPTGTAILRGFYYSNDALVTLAVPAAASSARIDSVVLRLDPTANSVRLFVKTGSTGNAPTLTQTDNGVYEFRICDFTVPANATTIAASGVTDRRTFSSQEWGEWTTATRPAGSREGKAGYNYTIKAPEFWDGNTWRPFFTPTTDASGLTAGTLANARLDYGVVAAMRGDRTVDAPMSGDLLNGDWNLALQPGAYRVFQGSSNLNSPIGGGAYPYGTLVVFAAGASMQSRTQVYFEHGTRVWTWTRTAWNGTDWTVWRRLAIAEEISALTTQIAAEESTRATGVSGLNTRVTTLEGRPKIRYGKVTASGFNHDSGTGRYVIAVPVIISPPMTGVTNIALFGTAISQDPGGVTVNQDPDINPGTGGGQLIVTRRNNFSTAINWMAVGS